MARGRFTLTIDFYSFGYLEIGYHNAHLYDSAEARGGGADTIS